MFLISFFIFGLCLYSVDAIDPALRRYGRFDIETEVTVPNKKERLQILEVSVKDTIFGPSTNVLIF
jgi:SpoVK/Ycf46/Vps4 family AAA+-type ATPase